MRGEAVFGQLQGRLHHLRQRHRAEMFQHREQGVQGSGHTGRQQTLSRNQRDSQRTEMRDRGAGRRGHVAVDRIDAISLRRPHQDRRLAADRMQMRVDDAFDQSGGDGGVDRVAAFGKHARAGCGRKVMLAGNHRAPAHQQWINGRHCG